MPRIHPPRLAFSRDDTAAALGLSSRQVDRLIANGRIRAVRLGGRVLVPVVELRRILGEDQPGSDPVITSAGGLR